MRAQEAVRHSDVTVRDAPSDGDVVRAVLAGDVERYGVLVSRYRERYARYAAQLLGSAERAEDALQDALVQAYERLAQCRDPDNFAGWFFLILRNRCFGERRRLARDGSPLDDAATTVAASGDAASGAERAELRRALQAALQTLTPEQREVFVLRHVEEMSYEQIAARTGQTVGALKMRMHRGYDRLRTLLKDHWQ